MTTIFWVKFREFGFDRERSLISYIFQIISMLTGWNTLLSNIVCELMDRLGLEFGA